MARGLRQQRQKMRTRKKQLIAENVEATVFVFGRTTHYPVLKHTVAVSDERPNDGIFLGDLNRERVVLGARLKKLSVGLLELSIGGEELGLTRGQSGGAQPC